MIEVALIVLIVAQQAFYMWQMHVLLNKLMSRNYTEYVQTQEMVKPPQNGFMVKLPDEAEQSENARINELNNMMGFGPI